MVTILNKKFGESRLTVKGVKLPLSTDKILGDGIDVTTLPEGHLTCVGCGGHRFECWVYLDNHRLELGCPKCSHSYRLLFPLDVSISKFGQTGRFTCFKHPQKYFILIKNLETICIGCEQCKTEVQIKLKTKSNLVLA